MSLYTAIATATGGRNGHAETSDGLLKFDLSVPKGMGGPGKAGATNPEQLFACGYAACFGGAMDFVANRDKIAAKDASVTAEVSFDAPPGKGFELSVVLRVKVPGMDRAEAEKLVAKAHEVCPYSKATRGNIPVELVVL
ncbi:MAG TPA: organic hydroperoxide resistance protein [Acetobacteraceae bacterium]|nr:organic hydroperoxide resistance protein [Acetobacteraceae bacterium]